MRSPTSNYFWNAKQVRPQQRHDKYEIFTKWFIFSSLSFFKKLCSQTSFHVLILSISVVWHHSITVSFFMSCKNRSKTFFTPFILYNSGNRFLFHHAARFSWLIHIFWAYCLSLMSLSSDCSWHGLYSEVTEVWCFCFKNCYSLIFYDQWFLCFLLFSIFCKVGFYNFNEESFQCFLFSFFIRLLSHLLLILSESTVVAW